MHLLFWIIRHHWINNHHVFNKKIFSSNSNSEKHFPIYGFSIFFGLIPAQCRFFQKSCCKITHGQRVNRYQSKKYLQLGKQRNITMEKKIIFCFTILRKAGNVYTSVLYTMSWSHSRCITSRTYYTEWINNK